jgi:hypothetical protein
MDSKQECKEAIKELTLYCETNDVIYYIKAVERLLNNTPKQEIKKSFDKTSQKNVKELHIR